MPLIVRHILISLCTITKEVIIKVRFGIDCFLKIFNCFIHGTLLAVSRFLLNSELVMLLRQSAIHNISNLLT